MTYFLNSRIASTTFNRTLTANTARQTATKSYGSSFRLSTGGSFLSTNPVSPQVLQAGGF